MNCFLYVASQITSAMEKILFCSLQLGPVYMFFLVDIYVISSVY